MRTYLERKVRWYWWMIRREQKKRARWFLQEWRQYSADSATTMSPIEQEIVAYIEEMITRHNRNNLTRTNAYLEIYLRHEELHWAFLAHMVSRNGGYGMTDVKGEWFTRLDETAQPDNFFAFLERANWLIFQDAYPQLLLYIEGKRIGQNLTHLLPRFGVSRFMISIWNKFWRHRDSALLTRALVINEQNFIEARVIQNPIYQQAVLHTLEFATQSLFGLNAVVFATAGQSPRRLIGTIVHRFASVDERITVGLRLYHTLFSDNTILQSVLRFATDVEHTGSRSDYWPEWFDATERSSSQLLRKYQPVFLQDNANHHPDALARVYSPELRDVWPDVTHKADEPGDWFVDVTMTVYLWTRVKHVTENFEEKYLQGVRFIETAIRNKEKLRQVERQVMA